MLRIPLFPLDAALLPGEELYLHIFEPRYRKMIGRCMQESIPFVLIRLHEGKMAAIGCEARVVKVLRRYPDGRFDIATCGGERMRVRKVQEHEDEYLEGEAEAIADTPEPSDYALEDRMDEAYRRYASAAGEIAPDPPPRGPRWSFRLAERLRATVDLRQSLLEMRSENQRLKRLLEHVGQLIPVLEKRNRGQTLVRGNGRLQGGT